MSAAESAVREGAEPSSRVFRAALLGLTSALSFSVLELALVGAALPATFSDVRGALLLAAELIALYFWLSMPIAAVGVLWSRFGPRFGFPSASTTYAVAFTITLTAFALHALEHALRSAPLEFPDRVALLELLARSGVLVVAVLIGRFALHPACARLLARAPRFASPKIALFVAATGASLALMLTGAWGLYALGIEELCAPAGIGALTLALAAAALVLSDVPRRFEKPVVGLVAFVTLLTPVAWRDPHARMIAYAHCPFAGPLLGVLRDVADVDGDGASPVWLGGTDCAESDRKRGPLEREIPGDGIDQDCRGGDAPLDVAPLLARALAPACVAGAGVRNVLVITVDALRHDAPSETITPRLLELAQGSLVFTRAYAPATLTRASFASLMGGRPLSDLGHGNLYADLDLSFGPTLATRFQAAGYRTFAFHYFNLPAHAFAGFDAVNQAPVLDKSLRGPKQELTSARLTNGVLQTVSARHERPFFVWAHYADLHAPYKGPENEHLIGLHPYLKTLAYLDHHLGRLFVGLQDAGLLASTIVALSADHGEALGERGMEGHGATLFDEVIRVPLLLTIPGCPAGVVQEPVSLSELGATLGAVLALPIPGRTLFASREAAASSGSAAGTAPLPVVVEAALTRNFFVGRAIVTSTHKLIHDVRNGGYLLFNLAADPDESRSIYRKDAQAASDMQARYQAWLDRPGKR